MMMGIKKRSTEPLPDYLHRRRSEAKKVLVATTGTLSTMLYCRHWSFFGHCLRNVGVPLIWQLMTFRNNCWWQEQRDLPWKWLSLIHI
eukprot:9028943-Karenia_brevis.AAC.1